MLLDGGMDRELVRDLLEETHLLFAFAGLLDLLEELLNFTMLGLEQIDRAHGDLRLCLRQALLAACHSPPAAISGRWREGRHRWVAGPRFRVAAVKRDSAHGLRARPSRKLAGERSNV